MLSSNARAGVNQLIVLTRSYSVYRAAAALTALVHLAASPYGTFHNFYHEVSRTEPIFHLESLVRPLEDSNPEKVYFLCLIDLAKLRLIPFNETRHPPSAEEAVFLRRRLLVILDSCQYVFLSSFDRLI